MTITPWQLYWITRLDLINEGFRVLLILSCIAVAVNGVCYGVNTDSINLGQDEDGWYKKWRKVNSSFLKIFIPVLIAASLAIGFFPTTKEMAAILIIPKIVNNEKVQQMPNKVLELADEWLDELRPKKEEGK